MSHDAEIFDDELDLLACQVDLRAARVVELGCGDAALARRLLQRFPAAELTALEVDPHQHERNLASPAPRLTFVHAGAERIPAPDAAFDGALMLKSLHHVPPLRMGAALAEVARVLVPDGWLYVSEPVYGGALNEIVRLFNDEREVRIAAQRALDDALCTGAWRQVADRQFEMPVRFRDWAEFEQRMLRPSWAADRDIDAGLLAQVRERFEPHVGAQGARFTRPMHVRVLRRGR